MVCPTCRSICDLGGPSSQFELNLPTVGASGGTGQEGGGQGFITGSLNQSRRCGARLLGLRRIDLHGHSFQSKV